jgi:drug/metabolite transporter (DMT)-like permease
MTKLKGINKMMHHMWFIYAILASVMWGLGYVLSEKVLHGGVSGHFLLFTSALMSMPIFLFSTYITKTLKPSLDILLDQRTLLSYLLISKLCVVFGSIFIFKSITLKNATYTSLIEITYPLFVILFSWLLFKDFHLNIITIVGALLVFCGVGLIYWKS